MTPVLKGQAKAVVVKEEAEDQDVEFITKKQDNMVWHKDVGGCASWVTFTFILANCSITMKRRGEMTCYSQTSSRCSISEPCFPSGNTSLIKYSSHHIPLTAEQ